MVGGHYSRDTNTQKGVISKFSPWRQTYMGSETMRRVLGAYGIRVRARGHTLRALARTGAGPIWCRKLMLGLP